MKNSKYKQTKTAINNKKTLTEMAIAWKQANGCFPNNSEFSAFINVCVGGTVFGTSTLNEAREITDSDLSWFANKLAVLNEDEAMKLPPFKPSDYVANIGGMETAMARYRNIASEAGVQLTPEMERTLERIHHSRGAESAGQTIQDMIGNLKQGNTQVNRGTTTTTSSTPKPTTTTTTTARTPTPQQRIAATAEVVSPSSGGQRAANVAGGLATAVGLGIPLGQMLDYYVTTPYLNKNYPSGGSYTVKDGKTYDSQGNVVNLPPYNK